MKEFSKTVAEAGAVLLGLVLVLMYLAVWVLVYSLPFVVAIYIARWMGVI